MAFFIRGAAVKGESFQPGVASLSAMIQAKRSSLPTATGLRTMPPRSAANLQFLIAAAVLLAALVLGGGQGTLGDSSVQLLALGLVGVSLWRHVAEEAARLPRIAWLALLPCTLPLLQLLPIPESLWLLPEARQALATELAAAPVDSAQRWSLVPLATERALVWLLPAIALYLSALQLDAGRRKALVGVLVAMAAVNVVLGLAQVAGGTDSALRFYTITNPTEAVGFFANRNHLASLLVIALPFVVVGTARWLGQREEWNAGTVLGLLAGIGLLALLILGIAIARSRAGLLLGMLALLGSLPIVLGLRRRRGTRRVLAVAVALGLTLAVQFALFGILQRLEKDPLEDARFQFLPVALETADAHAPLGSGLGGFRRAFEAGEEAPGAVYINRAHNDYTELWVDAGPFSLIAIGGALIVLAVGIWRARRRGSPGAVALATAAGLGLTLVALHSLGDYPLRTTAVLAAAGFLAGMMLASPREIRLSPAPDGARLA